MDRTTRTNRTINSIIFSFSLIFTTFLVSFGIKLSSSSWISVIIKVYTWYGNTKNPTGCLYRSLGLMSLYVYLFVFSNKCSCFEQFWRFYKQCLYAWEEPYFLKINKGFSSRILFNYVIRICDEETNLEFSVKMASTKMKIRESEQKLLDAIMNGITLSFVYYMCFLVLEICRLMNFSCPFDIGLHWKHVHDGQTYLKLYNCTRYARTPSYRVLTTGIFGYRFS